jgi:hypothetical protein
VHELSGAGQVHQQPAAHARLDGETKVEAAEEAGQVVEQEAVPTGPVVVGWNISAPAARASMLRAASWPT